MSTTYHPESDGQTEIVNKTIEQYLGMIIHDNPHCWLDMLSWAELWYNTSFHHSLRMTLFQALYRRPPSEIIDYRTDDSNVEAVNVLLQQRDKLLQEL